MPFRIQVSPNAAPSLEVSPVERSYLDITYTLACQILELPTKDSKKKNPGEPGINLLSVSRPVTIVHYNR